MSLKIVFHVEDPDTKAMLVEPQQVAIELTEDELRAADEKDAADLKKANDMIGDCFANRTSYGRGKIIRELFNATGIVIGKYLENRLAEYFRHQRYPTGYDVPDNAQNRFVKPVDKK